MRCELGSDAEGVRCNFLVGDLPRGADPARAWRALSAQGVFVHGSLSAYSAFCVYEVTTRREASRQAINGVDRLEICEPMETACSSFVHVQSELSGLDVAQLVLPAHAKNHATSHDQVRCLVLRELRPFKDAGQFRQFVDCVSDSEICGAFSCALAEARSVLCAYLLHGLPPDQRACLCSLAPPLPVPSLPHDSIDVPSLELSPPMIPCKDGEIVCLKALGACARVEVWGVTNIARGGAAEAIGTRLARLNGAIKPQTPGSRAVFNMVLPHAEASATVDMLENQFRRAHHRMGSAAGAEPLVLRNTVDTSCDCLVILDIFGDVPSAQQLELLLRAHNAAVASYVVLVGDERLPVPLRWPSRVTQDAGLWQCGAPIAALLALSRATRLGYSSAVSLPGASIFENAAAQEIAVGHLGGSSESSVWKSCELRASDGLCWHERCGAPPSPACGVSQRWLDGSTPLRWPARATDVEYRSKRGSHVLLPNGDIARVADVDFEPGTGARRLWLQGALGGTEAQAVAVPARLAPPIHCLTLNYLAFHSAGHSANVYG